MDLTSDFQAYHDRVTKSLVDVVRTGGQISNTDLSFHRSNEKVSRSLDQQNARLLRLTNKLLKAASQDSNLKVSTIRDQDGIDDNWLSVVDVVDCNLEKADASLDEFTGAIKTMSPAHQDGAQTPTRQTPLPTRSNPPRPSFQKVMHKPQLFFQRKVNNLDPEPFKPLLIKKPHAIKPLAESIGGGPEQYHHPYAEEIAQYKYPQRVYQSAPPIPFTSPEETSAILVDRVETLEEMLQQLKLANEIAVDLEHHDYRSYYGIVSLMQISTRDQDWIVDTLKPWREELRVLNEVFADPKILKVFHGSSMDMVWLQRDLGLYVVGLFDTYYACEALQFPGRGLKFLLQKFANFEAQKQYQMADWRIRPLPDELVKYARSDTHYLLYIYDMLRNMLVEQSTPQGDLVDHVLQGSKKEALQTYTRFVYNAESGRGPGGWYNLFTEYSNQVNKEQFAVFRALHEWRDKKAREEDEGLSFIFPNRTLWLLAEQMPTYTTELYRVLRPMPQMIAQHAKEIIDVIRDAKGAADADPLPYEFIRLNQEKYGIPHNRWRKFREEKAKTTHTGLGATLHQLTQNGEVGSTVNTPQANGIDPEPGPPTASRAQQSRLWGNVTTEMAVGLIETATALTALHAILPLPKLTDDAIAETNGIHPPTFSQDIDTPMEPFPRQQPQVTPTKVASNQANDVFTLKEKSRKRKADEIDDEEEDGQLLSIPATADDVAMPELSGAASPTLLDTIDLTVPASEYSDKRLAKQKRKAEKRARKAAKEAEAAAKAASVVPFDYENAESLIGSRSPPVDRNRGSQDKLRKANQSVKRDGKGKPMNPFAKALDTSTGAKRSKMGKELSGRSMTFQS